MKARILPKKQKRSEMLWQTVEGGIILSVVCLVVAFFVLDFVTSIILCALSLVCIILYFVIEHKIEYDLVKVHRIKYTHDPSMRESRANILLWGVVIAGLAIGNFFLQFARHGVTVGDIPMTAPFYKDAIALLFLTVVACLLAHAMHHSYHFARQLNVKGIHQARTIKSYILAFTYTFIIVYILLLFTPFNADFGFALLAAGLYVIFREFQRYDRRNYRKNVLKLHAKYQTLAPKKPSK